MVPYSWESAAGEKLFGVLRGSSTMKDSQEVRAALDALIKPLTDEVRKSGFEPKVFIEENSELNAFALPGGYVVLHTAVIEQAESADEVLGILAHEFAHVAERHVLRGMISTLGLYFGVSLLVGDYAGSLAALGDALPSLINLGFSRSYERAADDLGFEYLRAAQINPRGLILFFKRLHEKEETILATPGMGNALTFLSTHPNTLERIADLEAKIAAGGSPNYRVLSREFNELKNAIKN
jgi:predicted Zn-dependent protease